MPPQKDGKKICTACRRSLELSAFWKRAQLPDGLNARCKDCLNSDPKVAAYQRKYKDANREKMRERSRRHYAKNPAKRRAATKRWREENRLAYRAGKFVQHLKEFGITVEDWARMFNAQDRRCAVCRDPLDGGKNTHVDHCHRTGKVRGLLCTFCNSMLGYSRDIRENLLRGASYLGERDAGARSP